MSVDLNDVPEKLQQAVAAALAGVGVSDGHISLQLVEPQEIRDLNKTHRDKDRATDVLSFPIDGTGETTGPRELGDVVICPDHTADLEVAAIHGVLHLCGYDHESDDGEMMNLQQEIIDGFRGPEPE